jgi:hypothetical protein
MNVNPIKVNITLDSSKEGKWYAKENVTKRGDTEVTFFQRDGKRTLLQKFKDFRNGVRYGTELASKYSKELGLPKEALSNPKNKSEKSTMSNESLNEMFRTAHEKLQKNEPFQKLDPLVSNTDEKINITINKENINNTEDYKNFTLGYFQANLDKKSISYDGSKKHILLALDVRANPSFRADIKKIGEAIDALKNIKTITLTADPYKTQEYIDNLNKIFQTKVDNLIASLNTALKKTSNDSPSN